LRHWHGIMSNEVWYGIREMSVEEFDERRYLRHVSLKLGAGPR